MGSATRTAIVTGGSRGIGRAVAARLAAAGQNVAVVYASNAKEADAAVGEIEAAGARGIALQADVADEQQVADAFDTVERLLGPVDVLVNAAGVMALQPVRELDLTQLDRLVRTNVRGTFVTAKEAARRIRPGGAIIAFSTSVTRLHLPAYGAYAATKGAVEALVPILAKEMGERDVTVNAVAPGPTATELFFEGKSQQVIDRIAGLSALNRLGTPEDIAQVVAFLAGPGRWINGQVVFANGGAA
ncbi:SDR family oxidoreductase [Nonomuraea sp. KC401]|uniref:SDR family oxidoreductase n=1 Tax=unclassified Nonomuraea TaxID=2593643 RepID=UPI0010FF60C4|nr:MULTISPECIES: SDR family oxidoreductase [unclassified Nonomuraea]NBE97979.1 SDR family oxidoreductase [Nonomuraea sp. K271]TLF55335.1 SDR family oxidoreductase [Nonomuraea sp. KC401]